MWEKRRLMISDKNNVDCDDDDNNDDKIMVFCPFCKESFLTFWRWMSDGRQRDNITILKPIWRRLNAQFLTTIKKKSTTFSRSYVFTCLECFLMFLRAHTSYMLAVLKYLSARNSIQATKHVLWPYVCRNYWQHTSDNSTLFLL